MLRSLNGPQCPGCGRKHMTCGTNTDRLRIQRRGVRAHDAVHQLTERPCSPWSPIIESYIVQCVVTQAP